MFLISYWRLLQTLHFNRKESVSSVSISDTPGPSLHEAMERFKRYERKLNDMVRPNEEVLKRFTTNTNVQQLGQHLKAAPGQSAFPIGGMENESSVMQAKTIRTIFNLF